jgi:hypothetical protein
MLKRVMSVRTKIQQFHAVKKTRSLFFKEMTTFCRDIYDCPVKITKRKAKLRWNWKLPRLEARRLQFAQDPEIKKLFRQRSGGEAPMSILKNKMGLSRIRRRGRIKITLAVFLAATARGVLRTHQCLLRKAWEAMSKSKMLSNYRLKSHFYRFFCSTVLGSHPQCSRREECWGMAA